MSSGPIGLETARFFASRCRVWLPSGMNQVNSLAAAAAAACALMGAYGLGTIHGARDVRLASAAAPSISVKERATETSASTIPSGNRDRADLGVALASLGLAGVDIEGDLAHDQTRGFPLTLADLQEDYEILEREEMDGGDAATIAEPDFAAPPEDIAEVILSASETVGTDPALMLAIAHRESNFRPDAANRRSSAVGLYQFTNVTWMRAVMAFGADHGLGSIAKGIFRLDDGRMGVRGWDERTRLLELRKDAGLASLMAAELARDNGRRLEGLIGRSADTNDLYFAHLLGVRGAAKFLTTLADDPDRLAASVSPRAAAANPGIFAPGGEKRTVAEVYDSVAESMSARRNVFVGFLADSRSADASP